MLKILKVLEKLHFNDSEAEDHPLGNDTMKLLFFSVTKHIVYVILTVVIL